MVVIGKHLCGGATDLALRCAVQTLKRGVGHKQGGDLKGARAFPHVLRVSYSIVCSS